MAHISRPFQIALVALVLFVAVWFVALRGHSSTGASSSSSAPSPSSPAKAPAASHASGPGASQPTGSTYHGSAPGVAGLTRAIAKARGAAAQSQRNAKQLQQEAKEASGSGSSQPTGSAASKPARTPSSATSAHASPSVKTTPPSATSHKVANAPAKQSVVEGELKRGETVIVLFWSPRSAVDVTVHRQLALLQALHKAFGLPQDKHIVVHDARASEVGAFGTITRSLQVDQTPTMLVIAPKGSTKTLTGLVDAYAIQQAIGEARHS